ncbi:unnamed protein product [Didymodactylos carnosus]|uniref:Uncharacterized protein n=1 Tax=Didymodactylos carnosus TaxID=1234261 RepID=A0A816B6Q8_9BILA|nr:unnamed protein product [Didymodactylos carnosus]CAF1606587.1 unnamed protein product [Didymodactylos carnosus]CAF3994205.1 unnamed protein product [Didymodactylos carnosus]CAF4486717.1 unnamed protein product [Didymodactylos carnosus]
MMGEKPNLISLARVLIGIDEYEKAKPILTQVLNESPTENEMLNCYRFLADAARIQGENDVSLTNYFICLDLAQKIYSSGHPGIASTYSSIAEVYWQQENYNLSSEYCQKCLDILPEDHGNLADAYHIIGNVDTADYDLALDYYKKALVIQERKLPKDHINSAVTHNQMGVIYERKQDYPMAVQCYEETLRIDQKTLPSTHQNMTKDKNNILRVKEMLK